MALAEITNDQLIITLPVEKIYPGIKNDLEISKNGIENMLKDMLKDNDIIVEAING